MAVAVGESDGAIAVGICRLREVAGERSFLNLDAFVPSR